MEEHKQGMADLLEIYHGRQIQDEILRHLRRLRADNQQLMLTDVVRKRELICYYEALLITVTDMLQKIGDQVAVE